MTNLRTIGLVMGISAMCLLAAGRAEALNIQFDYRFDANGMFDVPQRVAALEAAASIYERFADELTAIQPGDGNTWSVSLTRPDGGGTAVVDDLAVAADTVVIFVGGWSFHPSVLGFAGQGQIVNAAGSDEWFDTLAARGQSGALADQPTDYGPWGGAITFNTNVDWHYGPAVAPAGPQPDFLTTAMHELGHILGFGEADSWFELISEGEDDSLLFNGAHTIDLLGEPAELDQYGSHWAEGTYSTVDGMLQETAMDPSTPRGQRQLMTVLDYAGFADIGWEITAVPEPTGLAVMMSVMTIMWRSRRR
ncbi:PEP-CTERM sorting domain-containing protein [Planctomycetales bacterium ZRK34]|nr:PEP-CTERM sorting domain-containing protein [Planctomycetales bacterium ZRK34]